MAVKETEDILKGFTDIEESFKAELKVIGRDSTLLLGLKEINTDFELYQTVSLIVVDVFNIYISKENLEGFLTAKPTETKYSDFQGLIIKINAIINGIKNFNNSNVADNFKNPNHMFFRIKERLTNAIEHLNYFLDKFKEIYEYYEGVVANG